MAILELVYFGNSVKQYLIFFAIILGSAIIGRILYYISKKFIRKFAAKTETKIDDIIVEVMEKPLVFLIVIIGFIIGLKTLTLSPGSEKFFANTIKIILTMDIFWFIILFVDSLIVHYLIPLTNKTESDLDDVLIPIVRKLVKVVLVILATIVIIDNFGYDVTSLVAGLGIGGLAFALAAKDMLANFFGGLAIISDKPFKIGDRIKVDKYDGWVEEIGIRTTKVKTLDNFQLIVPNSILANTTIENVSREDSRRVKTILGLEYGTSLKKIEEGKKILQEIVKKNKRTKDNSIIGLTDFAESSLEFTLIYWVTDVDNLVDVKHEINTEIKKHFEKAKIGMAFPTRTIYLKK